MGVDWSKMSYNESIANSNVDPASTLFLPGRIHTNVAYEFGAGLHLPLNKKWSASVEYIYASLGNASPENRSINYANLVAAPVFPLHNQSLLFGVSFTC